MRIKKDILSTKDVLALLQISRNTLYRAIEKEGLPALTVGKKRVYIHEDLLRWLRSREAKKDKRPLRKAKPPEPPPAPPPEPPPPEPPPEERPNDENIKSN